MTGALTRNAMKERLREGGLAVGSWIQLTRSPAIVRVMAVNGLDFAFIDTEHSSLNWETVGDLCELARASGIVPIVRPYALDARLANRLLDIGAMGLMFHDVTSRDEVELALDAIRHPPRGHRGVTSGGPPTDYRTGDAQELHQAIEYATALVIQIESRLGVDHLDAILAGGGVDVVEVGRNDLSTSLGVAGQIRSETVLATLDEIIATCGRHGVAVGVNAVNPDDANDLLERGVRCLSMGSDRSLLAAAYRAVATLVREHEKGAP
jgi:2-keto-3-deoxy-L-rhamnonate aldolase RhmA